MTEYYYVADEDDYRNADARDHRANPGAPAGGTFVRPGNFVRPGAVPVRPTYVQPTPVMQPAPVAPTYAPAPMPAQQYMQPNYYQPPGYPMQGYQGPGYPGPGYPGPGYPGPWGQPPGYCGFGGGFGGPAMQSLGRVLRIATPIAVSLLPLPAAPTAAVATGDCTTDLKASLANEANQITYQTSLAKAAKRDELVYAIGGGLGILLEKGLRP